MGAVTVSVVFTDLVGFTELASRLGPEPAEEAADLARRFGCAAVLARAEDALTSTT